MQLSKLCKQLDNVWNDNAGMSIIYTWIEWLQYNLLKYLDIYEETNKVIVTPLGDYHFYNNNDNDGDDEDEDIDVDDSSNQQDIDNNSLNGDSISTNKTQNESLHNNSNEVSVFKYIIIIKFLFLIILCC